MSGLELLEKHPYATEVIRTWFLEKMIESLNDQSVPDEFKDFMRGQGIDNDRLSTMIDANPRMLFDVFDENDLFIEIFMYSDVTFTCKIGNEATTNSWKTRKEAEMFAIEAAFDILENKLKPVLEDEESDIATGDNGDDQVHTE
jgi:hypothetical protein